MKRILLVLLFVIFVLPAFSQRRKAVFVEGLGNGIFLSGNFDMRFKPDQNDGLGFRAGIGGGVFNDNNDGSTNSFGLLTFPLSVNYLVGKKRSSFESGIGLTPLINNVSIQSIDNEFFNRSGLGVSGFLNIGYRFQPINNGFMFRINWSPAFNSAGFSPRWFGLSLGYSFK